MTEQKPTLRVVNGPSPARPAVPKNQALYNPLPKPMIGITPEQLWDFFSLYAEECEVEEQPLTMAGALLAMNLDGWRFEQLAVQEKYKHVCSLILLRIEEQYEKKLHTSASAGAQFWLKNRRRSTYGDRVELANADGEPLRLEHGSNELELLRRVGFLLANNQKTIEHQPDAPEGEEQK